MIVKKRIKIKSNRKMVLVGDWLMWFCLICGNDFECHLSSGLTRSSLQLTCLGGTDNLIRLA